jgi:flagellar biosynthesis protein FlhF
MKVQRFFSHSMQEVLRLVREELGPDAVILSNNKVPGGIEVVATTEYEEPRETEVFSSALRESSERPSASAIARMQAEKSLHLQDELDKAKQRIQSAQHLGKSSQQLNGQTAEVSPLDEEIYVQDSVVNQAPSTVDAKALNEVHAELKLLKGLIAQQTLQAAVPAEASTSGMTTVQKSISERLEALSFKRSLREKLVSAVAKASDFDLAWQKIREGLAGRIQVERSEVIDLGGVVALVGPTGSGKTTTIGKLAARYVMKYGAEGIALVTTDRFRIAAQEQLKVYGRILNVPVHIVDETRSLDSVLDSLSSKRLVLVDTAGLIPSDAAWAEQLKELKMSAHRVQSYLVAPAVDQFQVMYSNFKHYDMVGLQGVIVSKIDEAVSLGETISFLIESKLCAAYLTDGQRVPEDIGLLDSVELIDRAENLLDKPERWVSMSSDSGNEPPDFSGSKYTYSA